MARVSFRDALFAVREDDSLFFDIVFLIDLILLKICALLLCCNCYHQIIQLQGLYSIHCHCQGCLSSMFYPFTSLLHLLHYPRSILFCFRPCLHLHLVQ